LKGDAKADIECHIPEAYNYKVEYGRCSKEDKTEVKARWSVGKVDSLYTCQRYCNFYGWLPGTICTGFQFEEKTKTCTLYEDAAVLSGDGTIGTDCHIKKTPTFTTDVGQC